MNCLRATPSMLCMALLSATLSSSARGEEHEKKTTVRFRVPVQIPGVHLRGWAVMPVGTYVFKLVGTGSDRHIVQIFNKDETQIYATILAVPNYRLKPTTKTVITFNEGLTDRPEAIRAWFYPGANWGEEFVYSKAKAVELAKLNCLPVLAVASEVEVAAAKPEGPAVLAQLRHTPIIGVGPTGEEVEIAQFIQSDQPHLTCK